MIGSAWLQNRSSATIRGGSLSFSALAFSTLAVTFADTARQLPDVLQILLSAVSLALIATVVEAILLRWRASAVTGRWSYESASGNVGIGEIAMRGGSLTYNFSLYGNLEDAFADRQKSGHVTSPHTSFEDGFFWVNYKIDFRRSDYAPREGCVVITLPTNGISGTMTGYWFSTYISVSDDGTPSNSGELYFTRLEKRNVLAKRAS